MAFYERKTRRAELEPVWMERRLKNVFDLNLDHADVGRHPQMADVLKLTASVGRDKTYFDIHSAAEEKGTASLVRTRLIVPHNNANVEYAGEGNFKWLALLEFSKHLPVRQKDDILISLGAYLGRSKRKGSEK